MYNRTFCLRKAAILIFISGRCSAISSAKEGESGHIYNLAKRFIIIGLGRVNVRAFHENLTTHIC